MVVNASQSEKILDYIAGIFRTGFKVRSISWFGVGKVRIPENSMIITNKRILLIHVPLPGSDKVVARADIGIWQWTLAKKDIKKKLLELIKTRSINDIIKSHPKNYFIYYKDIEKIGFNKFMGKIIIKTKKEKFQYAIRDKKDFERAKKIFSNFAE